jgi:prevent-host-death family protein
VDMPAKPTETIAISEFKATCLAVLERVRRTGTSIVVTKRGEPVAEINPPSPKSTGEGWLGSMRGTATLADDLIAPVSPAGEWDAFGP